MNFHSPHWTGYAHTMGTGDIQDNMDNMKQLSQNQIGTFKIICINQYHEMEKEQLGDNYNNKMKLHSTPPIIQGQDMAAWTS